MKGHTRGLIALVLVLFLDGFGQGVIYPVLATALETPNSHILIQGIMSLSNREILYGVILFIYFFAWFFGAAILGDISDNVGRKRALVVVLIGMTIGNVLSALAFVYGSVWLLILGRLFVGFTAGSQAIAQAAIADISSKENQARNTGFVMAGVMIGFVVGPLAGGYLSSPQVVSWFSDATPLYLAGVLSFLNIILLMFLFKDTRQKSKHHPVRLSRALSLFSEALRHKRIRSLIICFLPLQFAWIAFVFELPTYWLQVLDGNAVGIALAMTWVGLGLAASMIFAVPFLENRCKSLTVIVVTYFLMAVTILLTLLTKNHTYIYALAFLCSFFVGTGYTFIIKVFSSHADENKQGWIMGVMNSSMVFATGISSLLSAWFFAINVQLPFIVAIVLAVLGIIALWWTENSQN